MLFARFHGGSWSVSFFFTYRLAVYILSVYRIDSLIGFGWLIGFRFRLVVLCY